MTNVLNRASANPRFKKEQFHRKQFRQSGIASLDDSKELFALSRECSKSDYVQQNLPRIVRKDVERAFPPATSATIGSKEEFLALQSNLKTHVKGLLISATISKGGEIVLVVGARELHGHPLGPSQFPDAITWLTVNAAKKASVESGLIERLTAIEASGKRDKALDELYDAIDEMLYEGKWPELGGLLKGLDVSRISVHLMLGLLTATLPANDQLSSAREALKSRVEAELRRRGEFRESLLSGL